MCAGLVGYWVWSEEELKKAFDSASIVRSTNTAVQLKRNKAQELDFNY